VVKSILRLDARRPASPRFQHHPTSTDGTTLSSCGRLPARTMLPNARAKCRPRRRQQASRSTQQAEHWKRLAKERIPWLVLHLMLDEVEAHVAYLVHLGESESRGSCVASTLSTICTRSALASSQSANNALLLKLESRSKLGHSATSLSPPSEAVGCVQLGSEKSCGDDGKPVPSQRQVPPLQLQEADTRLQAAWPHERQTMQRSPPHVSPSREHEPFCLAEQPGGIGWFSGAQLAQTKKKNASRTRTAARIMGQRSSSSGRAYKVSGGYEFRQGQQSERDDFGRAGSSPAAGHTRGRWIRARRWMSAFRAAFTGRDHREHDAPS
jgi:hypothetical protein